MKKFLTLVFISSFFSNTGKIAFIDFNNSIDQNSETTYTVKFYNDDFTLLSSKKYAVGETPIPPSTPGKESPLPEYNYTFNGWAPSISIVTGDINYIATYKTDVKTGKVIWIDGDGKTLATDTYAYGTMPHYQGSIPTKTPTTTKKFVFKGWGIVSPVLAEETTYVAQFDSIDIPISKYSIRIACENCLVNKKKEIIGEYDSGTPLSYQFNNTSAATYHYPYSLNVKVNGEVSNDYTYDNLTGKLDITLTGNTEIEAIADNSCVLMKYKYSADHSTVGIKCDGDFERVDWGDGSTIDVTNKTHTYSHTSETDQYNIRIFGKLSNIGTTSNAITSVDIFHSVTSIGANAFSGCSSLTSITIPDSVTSIGEFAFSSCSSLTSINIPNGVTSIGNRAFYNCRSLVSINIPTNVTSIGVFAFSGCSSLASIIIPDSVTSIGSSAFSYCSSLTSLTLPSLFEQKLHYYFSVSDPVPGSLKTVTLTNCTSIRDEAFLNCSSLVSIIIPDGVTSIGQRAFDGCSSLASIIIPDGVTSIPYEAFLDCSSLASISIPDSVTSIGECAFSGCSSLVSIIIPDGVTSIPYEAFSGCSSLASISIPASVTSIGEYAFKGCSSLDSITIPDGVTSIGKCAFEGCSLLTSINIPTGVTSIREYVFSGCYSLASITIPDGVTSIGASAFDGCSSLDSINIPTNVTSIGEFAFSGCSSLASITIPNGVTSIGKCAFYECDCSSLTSIIIPNSVIAMGSCIFGYCSNLKTINCEASSKPSGWNNDWNSKCSAEVIWGYNP